MAMVGILKVVDPLADRASTVQFSVPPSAESSPALDDVMAQPLGRPLFVKFSNSLELSVREITVAWSGPVLLNNTL